MHRHLLHLGDHGPLVLVGGHEAPGPGGGVLDEGPGKGDAALVGVADGVGRAGIGNAAHIVDVLGEALFLVGQGDEPAVAVAHGLHVHALVGGGGVAVIGPEEGADFHFPAGLRQDLHALRRDLHDLAWAQLPDHLIAKLGVGKGFQAHAVPILVLPDGQGQPSAAVPRGDQMAALPQDQDGRGALDDALGEADAVCKAALLVDHGGDQLIGIHASAGHHVEVAAAEGEVLLRQLLGVVDDADGADGVEPQVRADQQGLGIGVRDAADGGVAEHFRPDMLEFGAERGIFNVVDLPLQAVLRIVGRHARAASTQMRMVVRAEKDV